MPNRRAILSHLVDAVLLSAGAVSLFSFLKGYFPKGVDADKPPSGLSVETFGLEWRSASTHIVLLLSATCRYCTQSMPFYVRLRDAMANAPNQRLCAVFLHDLALGKTYLSTHGLGQIPIRGPVRLPWARASTPTLLLVDSTGRIVESFVGKLDSAKEELVMATLHSRNHLRAV